MAAPRARFSLAASTAGKKRASEEVASTSQQTPPKVPKASELSIEAGPRPARGPQRLPESAPVVVPLYKVTDKAGDVWSQFEDVDDAALWQIQIKHDARPSAIFDTVRSFNDFLKSVHTADESIPTTLTDLQRDAGIKLVIGDSQDSDGVGYERWRVAFYVAGDRAAKPLFNFLLLLDDYWKFKSKALSRDLEVHLNPHINVDIADVWEHLEYEHYTLEEPAKTLPIGIFDAHPVIGRRINTVHIRPDTSDSFNILIAGNSWNYRTRLDAHGVSGAYFDQDGSDEKRLYYRVMKDINVSEAGQKERVLQLLGDRVLNNLAVRVVLDKEVENETHVKAFIDELRELPNCHFK